MNQSIIKGCCNANLLNYLHKSILYHRLPKFWELTLGYLVSKPRKGIASKYFVNIECNLFYIVKVNDTCVITQVNA